MFFYRFDLDDFETGWFVATRFTRPPSARSHRDWVCAARDDKHALELARRAAEGEWPPPTTRGSLDFIVKFVDSAPTTLLDR